MGRELYQLVAISKNNVEYVIELNNDNKNNRGSLEFIDSGTTRFKDEAGLAKYLFDSGKIPTLNVKFAIKYNHNGVRYIPIVLNDKTFYDVSKNLDNIDYYTNFVFVMLKKIEAELYNGKFYEYLLAKNAINRGQQKNGNYLNMKLINSITEYFQTFVKTDDIDSNKAEFQYEILKELSNYKQLRTMYLFYNEYMKLKNMSVDFEFNESSKEEVDFEIPSEIDYAYRNGGMDEVYSITDLDDLENNGIRFR